MRGWGCKGFFTYKHEENQGHEWPVEWWLAWALHGGSCGRGVGGKGGDQEFEGDHLEGSLGIGAREA